jgi:hypothetical protein
MRSPERLEFERIASEQGLQAAIRWRDARFDRWFRSARDARARGRRRSMRWAWRRRRSASGRWIGAACRESGRTTAGPRPCAGRYSRCGSPAARGRGQRG